ncbi:MAG: hypothetical protein HY558_01975 [Euryarchaeota archaeon]|nr:hypothetical protein [Euryarchaeota archaeon]
MVVESVICYAWIRIEPAKANFNSYASSLNLVAGLFTGSLSLVFISPLFLPLAFITLALFFADVWGLTRSVRGGIIDKNLLLNSEVLHRIVRKLR